MDEGLPDRWTLAGFVTAVVLIGFNVVAVRVSNQELAPFWGATLRYVVAAVLLLAVVPLLRIEWPTGRRLHGSIWYGLLYFTGFFGFVYWGLVAVPASLASVVLATVPLFTYLMAVLVRLERFRWAALAGAVLAIVGIGIIAADGLRLDVPLTRFAAVVGAALSAAAAGVVVKRTPPTHPVAMNAVGMSAGAFALALLTWLAGEPVVSPRQTTTLVAVAFLILSSVLLFVILVWVIGRWTASGAAYALVLSPLVTIVAAHFLLDEPVTLRLLVGGLFVVLGVYWGALRRGHSTRSMWRSPG